MKKFSYLSSFIILIFALVFLFNNPDELNIIYLLNSQILILLLFIKFLTLLINANFNKTLLQSFNLNISNNESIYLGSLTFLGNLYLPGRSGGNLRMLYLNRKYKFKTPELASMYFYFFIVTIFLNSFVGIFCLIIIYQTYDALFYTSLIVFSIMLLVSFVLTFKRFQSTITNSNNKMFSWFNKLKISWNQITSNKKIRARLILLTLTNYIFFALEAYILINILFSENNILKIFYYNSLSVISSLASFTPASIGIKDTIIYLSSKILELNLSDVVSLMIAERAVLILFSILPGIFIFINQKK
tara:strand:+ start:2529 stop:3434 length:906 start_codon:yes stop_codon:yes gene_type:complete